MHREMLSKSIECAALGADQEQQGLIRRVAEILVRISPHVPDMLLKVQAQQWVSLIDRFGQPRCGENQGVMGGIEAQRKKRR